jgi:hypothetical protein
MIETKKVIKKISFNELSECVKNAFKKFLKEVPHVNENRVTVYTWFDETMQTIRLIINYWEGSNVDELTQLIKFMKSVEKCYNTNAEVSIKLLDRVNEKLILDIYVLSI